MNRVRHSRQAWFIVRVVTLGLMLVIFRPADAFAYIDPSTTSYFLQWLLAAALGAAFAIRIFWRNLKAFFFGLFSKKSDSDPDPGE